MYFLITVLIFVVCALLILIVLVQNSKGGGLASNFSSSNQVMGVRKTADFLEKSTWTLAVALLVLSLLASMTIPRPEEETKQSLIEDRIKSLPDQSAVQNWAANPQPQQENTENNQEQ